ncbi:hypothetical protein [Bacillus sp. Marseille-P3661]|uniref:hypothetical protein n=1 Tax=Bacillus sp. Marseille-P3661 TaxID=1936234 RepID=UPI002155A84A|nr:hypothetical protein [Bacillus sp. Marseille-P3661]
MIKRWLLGNLLIALLVIVWSYWNREYVSPIILSGQTIAIAAVILFLVNFNMYFVLLMIRKGKNKEVKKKLALFSRKMMKLHVPLAITAVALIIIHAFIMGVFHPIGLITLKKISGIVAIAVLYVHLFSGWLRRKKATGFRRKFHASISFVFFFFMFLHLMV